ncbi:MAG: phosphoenolpyruvate synthase, partial [Candidatus Thermoplasmatota archaeon]|nr:phosphoenolpyruvate synthase [Candidatus Thermoplasmatota archaeon]
QIIKNVDHIDEFKKESILVTEMTDPDWMPILKKASGVITDQGGRTSHAAIVSRELGIPAIIGTTNGTSAINDEMDITLSCAEGDKGVVYEGKLDFSEDEIDVKDVPSIDTQIMMNIGSPAAAFRWWKIPVNGIGLARMEFIINNIIKIHPMALISFNELKDKNVKEKINDLIKGYKDKTQFFVDQLSYGIAKIAASQYPDPVVVRTSDFKTNEYENLIGGAEFEKREDNPMIGFRGAFRYTSKRYEKAFALECKALKKVREDIGLNNIIIMIPFCRTLKEADNTLNILEENGLKRGKNGLQVYIMAEIPSNIILAEEFAERFDGFSIGSNDLTQLVLGVDRDSEELSEAFDENDKAIKLMIKELIQKAHKKNCTVGICGQAPSDYPDFAEFLVKHDIDSISLNPDSVLQVIQHISNLA